MNSLERMLAMLDHFSEDNPSLTADQLVSSSTASRATIYRYLSALNKAGLLAPAAGGRYVLGPKIIQFERLVRLHDPLLKAARPVFEELKAKLGETLLFASFYGENVLCLHQERPIWGVESSYERGRPMPLFRGATSKIILAYLPTYHLRNIMLRYAQEIADAGLGQSWDEFRGTLKRIRKNGYCQAAGEIDRGVAAVACPVFLPGRRIAGSLTIVLPETRATPDALASIRATLVEAAADVSRRLEELDGPDAEERVLNYPSARRLRA